MVLADLTLYGVIFASSIGHTAQFFHHAWQYYAFELERYCRTVGHGSRYRKTRDTSIQQKAWTLHIPHAGWLSQTALTSMKVLLDNAISTSIRLKLPIERGVDGRPLQPCAIWWSLFDGTGNRLLTSAAVDVQNTGLGNTAGLVGP